MFFLGSNYFPYRPEVNLAFERDYKSYPEYSCDATYYEHREYYPATTYNYPRIGAAANVSNTRKPQMGISASNHRRTHSNISTASSNINPGFQLEHDELNTVYDYKKLNQMPTLPPQSPATNRLRVYENVPFIHNDLSLNYFPTTSNTEFTTIDRPDSLPFDNHSNTKLRSSLKKYTNTTIRTTLNYAVGSNGSNVAQHQRVVTPTNPTPPDSLTSDDSSYLSAKDGSISSHSRVRFSPEAIHDQSSAQGQMILMPTSPQIQSLATPIRRLSRPRHSISDSLSPSTTTS